MELLAWALRMVYRLFALFPQQRKVVFLSRQSARPFDFSLLEPALAERLPDRRIVWCCVSVIGEMSVPLMLAQLWHVATAELCLVDGYVPAVSLPHAHRAAVAQLWHAPGAIKKFGYQSLDTPAGRPSRTARVLRMHRGYDFVVAGTPGAVSSFSQAFDVPVEKILPLGLPRMDYLRSDRFARRRARRFERAERAVEAAFSPESHAAGPTVLYAPTFRKGNADAQWLGHAVAELAGALEKTGARLLVAGHPLDDIGELEGPGKTPVGFVRGVPTIDLLHLADLVVTDYSTVAFEAAVARCKTLFFVPDIEEYRRSPGLNIDPLAELPTLSSTSAGLVADVVTGRVAYDGESFSRFMDAQLGDAAEGATARIVDALAAVVEKGASA